MTIRSIIVEDEPPARANLRSMLEQTDSVKVVGEAADALEAIRLIKTATPDLIFLDIQLPGMTGIQMAEVLRELDYQPYVVLVTAYDQYAVKAFDIEAVDYLLKPFDEQRLGRAIERVEKAIARSARRTQPAAWHEFMRNRLAVERGEKTLLLDIEHIVFAFVKTDGVVYVKTFDDVLRCRSSLKELENRLSEFGFFRAHRSFLVNLSHVKEIIPWFNKAYVLRMDDADNTEITVSRSQSRKLRHLLGL